MWDDLICPFDHGTLEGCGPWFSCRRCGRGYPVVDSIPTFLPCEESEAWREHQDLLAKEMFRSPQETEHGWSRSIRWRGRAMEARLRQHIELGPRTRMLQIGLRGQGEIHHFSCGIRYGVDPLAGVMADQGRLKWGQVRWASACGEALPFPSNHFQAIVLSDILGSVESPEKVLQEAQRCLHADGVFVTVLPTTRLGFGSTKRRQGIKSLRRVSRQRVLKWARQAGLKQVWSGYSTATGDEDSSQNLFAPPKDHRSTRFYAHVFQPLGKAKASPTQVHGNPASLESVRVTE